MCCVGYDIFNQACLNQALYFVCMEKYIIYQSRAGLFTLYSMTNGKSRTSIMEKDYLHMFGHLDNSDRDDKLVLQAYAD